MMRMIITALMLPIFLEALIVHGVFCCVDVESGHAVQQDTGLPNTVL